MKVFILSLIHSILIAPFITFYKNKVYDNGNVVSEQKVNINCNSLEDTKKLFKYLNYEELVEVKYHVLVMEKNGLKLAFHTVESIGTLIEYGDVDDFSNKTNSKIKDIKKIGANRKKFISKNYFYIQIKRLKIKNLIL